MQQLSAEPFDVYLIGDTGGVNRLLADPVMDTLKAHLDPRERSAVVFLGDNIYPNGLPDNWHILRKDAELALRAHHTAMKDYHGRVFFIGGNHDWNKGKRNGLDYILRQEKYLEELFGENVFHPSGGCPGPKELKLSAEFTLVLINTQWWMQPDLGPLGIQAGCSVSSEEEFFYKLIEILEDNKGKRILICGHHPVYSYAIHGGKFKLKHHLFPLTMYHPKAWIPLPLIGSLLPLYRQLRGAKEDMSHPRYRRIRKRLKEIFKKYPNLIYAAGHEHNLQHIEKDRNHFLVSGAGSKLKYVLQNGKYLRFGVKGRGFLKVHFEDGAADVSAWVIDNTVKKGKLVYEKRIVGPLVET